MVEFFEEDYASAMLDMVPLFMDHWEEVAVYKDKMIPNIDFDMYAEQSAQGNMIFYTARDNGKLIGYFVVFLKRNPHYKDHVYAVNDAIFLDQEYRKQRVGADLIKFAEESVKNKGASVLVINTKVHKPFYNLLDNLGFQEIERSYSKYIGD